MPPRPIIIDTDPGQDDAVAILLALASPELEVVGITTVAGNVALEKTTGNARRVCELAGRRDIAVAAGAARPLLRQGGVSGAHKHGKSGLDGAQLPEPTMPLDPRHGVDFILETLMAAPPGTVTVCALGPLTNIAHALIRAPEIVARARELVLMGGAYFAVGNITPTAEFNTFCDPEAAKRVYASGLPIVTIPLDCTHLALATRARVAALRALATPVGRATADWLAFSERFDVRKYGGDGAPLHDPCVVAYLLQPELFSGRHVNVEVEVQSPLTDGMTVIDWWGVTDRPKNATVLHDLDSDGLFSLLTQRLARL